MGGRGANVTAGKSSVWERVAYGGDKEVTAGFRGGVNIDDVAVSKKSKEFMRFLFNGMDVERASNQYLAVKSVSSDGNKAVLRIGSDHFHKTPYGYAIDVGPKKVVYVKDWQVNSNHYGNHVLFDKKYYSVKDSKYENYNLSFEGESSNGWSWDYIKKIAKSQG